MQLTYHTDFALRVLIYLLDRPEKTVTTREMAEFYGISLNHLTKVAKALTRGGWLLATRGGGGGLRLAPHTAETSVGEIVRFTENLVLLECFDPKLNTCPITRSCHLKGVLHRARHAFLEVLDGCTVRDLVGSTAIRELAPGGDTGAERPATPALHL